MPAIGQPLPPRRVPSAIPLPASTTDPNQGPWWLRSATLADVQVLAMLEAELFPDEAWDAVMIREEISHPSRRYVCAVTGRSESGEKTPGGSAGPADVGSERILGYAGIMLAGDLADLHTIGTIRPGEGIGRALLHWCEENAAVGGAERLLLEVRVDNERARVFYRKAGYSELGWRRGYYHTPTGVIDAIVMEKSL